MFDTDKKFIHLGVKLLFTIPFILFLTLKKFANLIPLLFFYKVINNYYSCTMFRELTNYWVSKYLQFLLFYFDT